MVIVGKPSSTKDPKTYGKILGQIDENEWLMAVEVELGNMARHQVWVVAPKDPRARELDTVWVFKQKFDTDGCSVCLPQQRTRRVKVPKGLGVELPHGCGLKLQRLLYGLKQSPRCWYNVLKEFFVSIQFKPSVVDPCLFVHSDPKSPCFVFVHIDDLVIIGPNVSFLKTKIQARFEMEDLGKCRYVLGMRVT